jgi:hypothetical protein
MNKKILLVEDNNDSLEILGLRVTNFGYEAIKAHNSKEAIACVEAEPPDLILMDLDLPDVDGVKTNHSWLLLLITLNRSKFWSTYCAMAQKALAVLLVLSWIIFSVVDMLEDLDFESGNTPSASRSPTTAKPVKLANDTVELANWTSPSFDKFSSLMDLENTSCNMLAATSVDSPVLMNTPSTSRRKS